MSFEIDEATLSLHGLAEPTDPASLESYLFDSEDMQSLLKEMVSAELSSFSMEQLVEALRHEASRLSFHDILRLLRGEVVDLTVDSSGAATSMAVTDSTNWEGPLRAAQLGQGALTEGSPHAKLSYATCESEAMKRVSIEENLTRDAQPRASDGAAGNSAQAAHRSPVAINSGDVAHGKGDGQVKVIRLRRHTGKMQADNIPACTSPPASQLRAAEAVPLGSSAEQMLVFAHSESPAVAADSSEGAHEDGASVPKRIRLRRPASGSVGDGEASVERGPASSQEDVTKTDAVGTSVAEPAQPMGRKVCGVHGIVILRGRD
jgi:hypothetical protein